MNRTASNSSFICIQFGCLQLSSLYIKRGKVSVRTYVRNAGRGQLSSEWRNNDNDVTLIIAGRRYGDWRHAAMGCNALVQLIW